VTSFTDAKYLRDEQYRDDSNLRARIELHRRFSTEPEPWHRWVFDRLHFPAEAKILEVGCGPGELWLQNADRVPDGWDEIISREYERSLRCGGASCAGARATVAVPHGQSAPRIRRIAADDSSALATNPAAGLSAIRSA